MSRLDRWVAGALAAVWSLGGLAALGLATFRGYRLGWLLGPLAVAYGALWVRVAWTGRRLRWP